MTPRGDREGPGTVSTHATAAATHDGRPENGTPLPADVRAELRRLLCAVLVADFHESLPEFWRDSDDSQATVKPLQRFNPSSETGR
jgi:hypothetical protein